MKESENEAYKADEVCIITCLMALQKLAEHHLKQSVKGDSVAEHHAVLAKRRVLHYIISFDQDTTRRDFGGTS